MTREELIRGTFGSAEEREKMREASDAKPATQRVAALTRRVIEATLA